MSCSQQTFAAVTFSMLMASAVMAQVNRGTITGIVTDPSGAAVPGVTVSVTDQSMGVATNVTTTSAGVYTAPLLLPGTYTLTAEKQGFKKYERTGIVVGVGDTIREDVSMSIGMATQTVQVSGTAPLLQQDTAELGNVVTGQEVEELPLTSVGDQRSPASFMKLAPGVTGRGNSDGGPGANQYMTTSVSGSIVSSTTLKLDGGDFPTASGFEGDLRTLQIPPDAIAEFKLVASNAPAEYGRSAGGTASFQVKSGTNQIHGTAYEFVRNTALNANPWFVNSSNPNCDANGRPTTVNPVQACKAPYKQNEFGVTAGAPIKKDKAFIFGYYDGFRLIQGNATGSYTIPTPAMLQGDFTAPGIPTLYDPLTQTTCGTLICNNHVLKIDPVSAKIVPLFPAPTSPGILNNYISTTSSPLSVNMWGLKGDYVITEANRIAVTYAYGKNSTPNTPSIPAPLEGGDQPSINETRNIRLNYNLMLRPNLINQATASFNQWNSGQQPVAKYGGRNDWVSYLGLKGFAPIYGTEFPQFVLDGYSFNGGGGAGFNNAHSEGIDDSLTWVRGKHTIKMGFQWLKEAQNSLSSGRTGGYFNFVKSETGLLGNGNTGYGVASFLLGRADEEQAQYIYAPSYNRVGYYAAFAQDDFKVTRKFTLNLGLRWDLFTPDFQKYYHKGWVDPTLPNPALTPNILGTFVVASPSNPTGVNTYYRNFSPRVSVAYALNNKTVIRTGYGIFFGQGNATQLDNGSYVQGFNGNTGTTSNNGLTPGFIWSVDSATPFVPSFGPNTFLGGGTPKHSAGTLIELQKTDGMAPYAQNWNFTVERQLPGQMTLTAAYVGNTGIHLPSRGLAPMDKMPPQYLSYGPTNFCWGGGGTVVNAAGQTVPNPLPVEVEAPCAGLANASQYTQISLLQLPISDPNVQATAPVSAMPADSATGHKSPFKGFETLYPTAVSTSLDSNGVLSASVNGIGTMGQALRTNPQYQGLHRYYESLGVSTYHALQVKLDKHFSNGLTLLVSYAWSKTLTDAGSMFSTFSSQFGSTTPWNRHLQKGPSFMDIPNNLVISYIYDFPFGQGKKFANQGGVVNQIVGGWKWSGVLTYQSGLPQNIQAGPSAIPGGLEDQGWGNANQVLGVPLRCPSASGHFDPHKDCLINEAAFVVPPAWTFGTFAASSGAIRQFGYTNEDMSLMKEWKIREQVTLRFNADFFNVFNRTIFNQDGNNGAYAAEPTVNYPGFGTLGGQANIPRQIQFGLRLKW
jgi:hypothetical protein